MSKGLTEVLTKVIIEAGWSAKQVATFDIKTLAESIIEEMMHYEGDSWEYVPLTNEEYKAMKKDGCEDAKEMLEQVGYDVDTPSEYAEHVAEDGDEAYINIEVGRCGFDVKTGECVGS